MNKIPRSIAGWLLTAGFVCLVSVCLVSAQGDEMTKEQAIAYLNRVVTPEHPPKGMGYTRHFYTTFDEVQVTSKEVCDDCFWKGKYGTTRSKTFSYSSISNVKADSSGRVAYVYVDAGNCIETSVYGREEKSCSIRMPGDGDVERAIKRLVKLDVPKGSGVDLVFVHGDPDYLDLTGKHVFHSVNSNNPYGTSNVESFVIGHKAWTILGDLAYTPRFFYETDRLELQGSNGKTVYMSKIKRYPELVERYNSIKPSSVGWTLVAKLTFKDKEFSRKFVYFKATNIDLGYGNSRSNSNVVSPASPLKLKYAASTDDDPLRRFSDSDRTDEKELAKLLNNVHSTDSLEIASIEMKWPLDAIDKLQDDYLALEKARLNKASPTSSKPAANTSRPKPRSKRPGQ